MHRVFKQSNVTLSKECVTLHDISDADIEDNIIDEGDADDADYNEDEDGEHVIVTEPAKSKEPKLYRFPTIEEKEREELLKGTTSELHYTVDDEKPVKATDAAGHKQKHRGQTAEASQELYNDMVQKAIAEASRILEQAHDKAMNDYNEIIAKGEETVVSEREKARRDGFAEGMRTQIDNVRDCIRKLEASIADIEGRQETFFMQSEADLKWLALEIAAKVMCERANEDELAILPLVKQAVASNKNSKWLTVEVSNEAEKLLDRLYTDIAQSDPERIKIEPVEAKANTCLITTPDGYIDASLYRQIENLKQYFENSNGESDEQSTISRPD